MPGFSLSLPKIFASLAAFTLAVLAQCAGAQEREAVQAALQLVPIQLDLAQLEIDPEGPSLFAITALSGEARPALRAGSVWSGERAEVVGIAVSGKGYLGVHEVSASLGSYETTRRVDPSLAGALALKVPLAAIGQFARPGYGLRLIDGDALPLRQPGFFASLAWGLPGSFRLEASHSDTLGDPDLAMAALQGSWQSRSDTMSLVTDLGRGWQLRAQGFQGRTVARDRTGGTAWIDTNYRAGSAMVSRSFGQNQFSARFDAFSTRNRGSLVDARDNEDGWALSLAASRKLGPLAMARAELVHMDSRRTFSPATQGGAVHRQDSLRLSMQVKW